MTATAPPEPTAADRRIAPRRQPVFGTICWLNPADTGDWRTVGLVWNLSETGVSMLVSDPPQPGATLAGELAIESGGPGLPVGLRVVHVRPVPTGDYFLGARFDRRLAPDEMRPFLIPPPPPADADGMARPG